MPSSSIDDMIQSAAARGDEVQSNASVPAVAEQRVVAEYAPVRRPSLDNLLTSSMSVDNWLKVTEDGLKIIQDNKTALLDTLKVTIDMSEVVATSAIKFGNPPQYYKTYDGLICSDGSTRWNDAITKGANHVPASYPYDSADIPMTLAEDVKARDGTVIMTAGQRIGYSLSTTNKGAYADFQRKINDQNLRNEKVDVTLGYESRTNKNKNVWGIVTFTLEGAANEAGE